MPFKLAKAAKQIIRKKVTEAENDPYWHENDGWRKDAFQEVGLLSVMQRMAKFQYEIESARRGYAFSGENIEDVVKDLKELCDEIQGIIEDLESDPDLGSWN